MEDENKYKDENEILDNEEDTNSDVIEEQSFNSVNEDLDTENVDDEKETFDEEFDDNTDSSFAEEDSNNDDNEESEDEEYTDLDEESYIDEDSNLPSENKEKIESLILENHNLKNQIDILNTKIDNLETKFMANEAKIIEDANNYYHLKLNDYERKNPRGATKLALYGRKISIIAFILATISVSAYISLSLFKSTNPVLFTTIINITTYLMYGLLGMSALALVFAVFGIIYGKRKGVAIAAIIFAVFTIGLIIAILFTPAKDSILNMPNNTTNA